MAKARKKAAGNSKKTVGRPFKKGKSGNPNGRPKVVVAFRDLARKAVDDHVIDKWIEEVRSGGRDWLRCSELLTNYGYGKPKEYREITGSDGEAIQIEWKESAERFDHRLDSITERIAKAKAKS